MSFADILWIIAITFLPALELRASIPYGILKAGMPWYSVFIIAVIANILVGVIAYLLIDFAVRIVTKIKVIEKFWKMYVKRTQKNIRDAVEKYGELGLAIFIGIPLPGTGVYTGAVAAYLTGMDFKKTMVSVILGVLIAAVIVTAVVMTGSGAFSLFVKMMNGA